MQWIDRHRLLWPARKANWIDRATRPMTARIGPRLAYRTATPTIEPIAHDRVVAAGYSSQIGQDLILDRHVFGRRDNGVFVDVGAHGGVHFSNTYFFEQSRNWTGLCIEPNPAVFAELEARRTATCVQSAVGTHAGSVAFQQVNGPSMLSGVVQHYDRRHQARIEREVRNEGGSIDVIDVEVRRLSDLLRDAGLDHVDLLSIDVEGAELDVIDSITLRDFGVRAVIVENNFRSWAIPRALRAQQYQLMFRIGWDELYMPVAP